MAAFGFLSFVLLASPVLAQTGSVLRSQKISALSGGLTGTLDLDEAFGSVLAPLGDVDGNGVADLAVGAYSGSVWILLLDSAGTVVAERELGAGLGGFTGTPGRFFGRSLAPLGDLDGDGIGELAVCSSEPNKVWVLFLAADGSVRTHSEVRFSDPAFQPPTFGRPFDWGDVVGLGDVDGDGVGDLVWAAPFDDDGGTDTGSIWIVRLNADGTTKSTQKISPTHGGFAAELEPGVGLGRHVTSMGDLDGDGHVDLLVRAGWDNWLLHLDAGASVGSQALLPVWGYRQPGAPQSITLYFAKSVGDLDGDGVVDLATGVPEFRVRGSGVETGAVVLSFVRSDVSVREHLLLSSERGGLGALPAESYFGYPVVPVGDLDGNGSLDLAVGAPSDADGGRNKGAVWILFLDPDATRNGSGVNPETLTQAAEPVLGASWSTTLDCSGHGSGIALLMGWSRALSGLFVPEGEVLVDLVNGQRLFVRVAPHAGGPVSFTLPVPNDLTLIDLELHVQGYASGAPGARLSNALDVVIGR